VTNHEITSDGNPAAAQHLRGLTAAVAAIPDVGPQPLRADTPLPDVFASTDRADLRELNFDGYLQAGATGQQTDGSIGFWRLACAVVLGPLATNARSSAIFRKKRWKQPAQPTPRFRL